MMDENKIIVEVFPAKKGDSFLVQLGLTNLLIDCGYSETYRNFIKPKLEDLKNNNQKLDILIVTHIDKDHISGAINLLNENVNIIENKIIEIKQIWHNSYKHLDIERVNEKISSESKRLLNSLPPKSSPNKEEQTVSAKQGSSFAAQIQEGNYEWNSDFNNGVISNTNEKVIINDKIKLTLLSPGKENLSKLQKFWNRELIKLGFNGKMSNDKIFDDAFEFLLLHEKLNVKSTFERPVSAKEINIDELMKVDFREDQSPTNGSSIAFIIEYSGNRMLFLGDSHPSVIIESLKKNYPEKEFPIQFDLIKISHHGSFDNNDPTLLKMIDSSRFIISTDGTEYDHPDLETLSWIVGRETKVKRCLYFNYKHAGTVFLDNKDYQQKYKYEIITAENDMSIKIEI